MPYYWVVILLGVIILVIWGISFPKIYKKPGQAGEEETLRIIKMFIKQKGWTKNDYLLVNNLILQKENYWSCEIDILLLTRKWIYVIEVKDWFRGKLTGNLNHEYLEHSYKVGKQRRHQRHRMYSPFWQNETHVKRFKNYFQLLNNQNILSVICFHSPYLAIDLKENKKTVFENKHLWVKNGRNRNIADLLAYYETKNAQWPFFEQLKEKISKEVITFAKIRKHRAWSKSVREGKELERRWR